MILPEYSLVLPEELNPLCRRRPLYAGCAMVEIAQDVNTRPTTDTKIDLRAWNGFILLPCKTGNVPCRQSQGGVGRGSDQRWLGSLDSAIQRDAWFIWCSAFRRLCVVRKLWHRLSTKDINTMSNELFSSFSSENDLSSHS